MHYHLINENEVIGIITLRCRFRKWSDPSPNSLLWNPSKSQSNCLHSSVVPNLKYQVLKIIGRSPVRLSWPLWTLWSRSFSRRCPGTPLVLISLIRHICFSIPVLEYLLQWTFCESHYSKEDYARIMFSSQHNERAVICSTFLEICRLSPYLLSSVLNIIIQKFMFEYILILIAKL